jgi:hypothetical protein
MNNDELPITKLENVLKNNMDRETTQNASYESPN